MGRKKLVCIFLVCLVMIGSFCIPAGAVKNATQETSIVMRATGKFDVEKRVAVSHWSQERQLQLMRPILQDLRM